ncbi:hypothetical protein FQN55_006944 [Onygenales sp. PD_40]|nr:hypothetical protein FQN55_006944 [Onygenales sp. PD_40]KAK2797075.1 hypothetical protein FQN51_008847 [Onygenales sp. PD_10]
MDESVGSLLKGLEEKYCPPLDPALFAAIAGDFDLHDENSIRQFRGVLDELKISAAEQENVLFDPSGTSGQDYALDNDEPASERSESQPTLPSLKSNITSLESDISSISLEQRRPARLKQQWQEETENLRPCVKASSPERTSRTFPKLTFEEKTADLMAMFPTIGRYTIEHTLGTCDGDVERSMDVLLNLAFFEDQVSDEEDHKVAIPKGIEGFQGNAYSSRGRKKGKKNQTRKHEILRNSSSASSSRSQSNGGIQNKWDNSKKDVDFVCARTYLSSKSVASAYHLNGASLPSTIHFLASTEAEKHSKSMMDDPVTVTQIAELRQDFGTVSPEKLAGLLRLARNSISAANELATVMVTVRPPPNPTEIVQIKQTPIQLDDSPSQETTELQWTQRAPRTPTDYATTRAVANSHFVAGNSAFTKATAAYRRGKSDHLMGGAAGYYSMVGREHMDRAKKEAAAAADALVESQSSARGLDLHGVSVQHAVGIAKRNVAAWWDGLGDTKYAPGAWGPRQEGYRIITGLGRHSKNGTARLGPAVVRALAKEGWRVEVGEGYLTVTGIARHR